MRIAIFGAGAVGGYFGARLIQAGKEVLLIARGDHLKALKKQGLRIDSIKGDVRLPSVNATDDPAQAGIVDVVFVCVKTWQLLEAARVMQPLIGPETMVVPLLNGVEAPFQLAEAIGDEHVLGGLSKIISVIAGPGHIHHIGAEPYVAFGELNNTRTKRAELLLEVFEDAGIHTEIPPDIHSALWAKFLFVVSLGGVGAITRAPIGVLRELPQTRLLLEQAMQEIFSVAQARNIALPKEIITDTMAFVDTLPPGGTASMQRDIVEGRLSEIDSWNGAVVRLGQEAGVAVPLHTFIYNSLLPLELKSRGQLKFPA
jgi:2-dehydropantoate 2-reductase